jgi:hypothetical protein
LGQAPALDGLTEMACELGFGQLFLGLSEAQGRRIRCRCSRSP